jgi:Gpi18-like mannosyltransferase
MEGLPAAWRLRLREAAKPVGFALILAAVLDHDWDGFVFRTVVEQFLHGHSPYAVAAQSPFYAYLGPTDTTTQWWAYPPLMLLGMAATYWPALFLHLPAFLDRVLWKLPMVASLVALAWVAGAWARRFGSADEEARRVEQRFLRNPYLLLVAAAWGMTDVALMAFYLGGLLAYGNGKPAKAGVLVGLAFLVKPFPALLVLPMLPYLVRRHGWGAASRFALAGGATVGLVCAPFYLSDPAGFWQQVVGMHVARGVQGLTLWQLIPRDLMPDSVVKVVSPVLMVVSLIAVGFLSTRLKGKGTTLMLTLLAGIAILVWNRVVNEQYLVLVVAPLLILDQLHVLDRLGHFLTRWAPNLFAAVILIGGFHFLTFLPPDVANILLFHTPVDLAAERLRGLSPDFWWWFQNLLVAAVIAALFALAWLALRILHGQRSGAPVGVRHVLPTGALGLMLVFVGVLPALGGAAAPTNPFVPVTAEPQVAAFHYLWWQNPAHDPAVRYGNWPAVSQVPSIGYYTSTRGVARDEVRMMVEHGIDTAIVSYHRGELERFKTFQEEATKVGLRVAPLIELNQVYDQPAHHPVDQAGEPVPYAAYRLDSGTKDAIGQFVLDLKDQLAQPSTLKLDGRPVVLFYDSYVSGVGYDPEDQRSLAEALLREVPIGELREAFGDPGMQATAPAVLRHYPAILGGFYDPGAASLWRRAHLAEHIAFWQDLRAGLEAKLGPLYLISGDALNERAGFAAGTVKFVEGLQVFDGAFIYSPSFTWGNQPKAPFNDTFDLWEDRNHWLTAFANAQGAASVFGIGPSYDDTVNRPNGFKVPAFPDGPKGETFYDRSWASALAQPPTLGAIATFNEFFEGSSIEPSVEYGTQFLDATKVHAAQMRAQAPASRDVLVVLNERSARTSLVYSETDLSHFWGLDLLAAASRSIPDARVAAVDALQPGGSQAGRPDLLLVEGGRAEFAASPAVKQQLASAVGNGTPFVIFGSDLVSELNPILDDTCLGGLDAAPGNVTLHAGDRLRAEPGKLWLDRGNGTYLAGAACKPGHAATSIKPWAATDPLKQAWGGRYDGVNAECLGVTLKALAPAFAPIHASDSCTIP